MEESHKYRVHFPTLEDLERYPVWAPDEGHGFEEPVLDYNPLPDEFPWLLIKSHFVSCQGREFDGYVVFNGVVVYAIELSVNGQEFGFSDLLTAEAQQELEKIQKWLGAIDEQFFPMSYFTSQVTSEGMKVEGRFDPFG